MYKTFFKIDVWFCYCFDATATAIVEFVVLYIYDVYQFVVLGDFYKSFGCYYKSMKTK